MSEHAAIAAPVANPYRSKKPMDAVRQSRLAAYPELLQRLLAARDIDSAEEAERFLAPDYDAHTHDPFLMKDMDKAVERLLRAVRGGEKIVIYTDYDADGIPAGVVMHDFFKKIGFSNFTNYFPHRHDEGFGFHKEAVEGFAAEGVKLILTADCGIADIGTAARAAELGIDVIISDHHLPHAAADGSEELPAACAVLDPKRAGCAYPDKGLCGSGVIYKLVQGVLARDRFGLREGMEKWWLDMVGLATMADMVPLTGENRVFARYGLTVLRKSPRLGLMKLFRQMKIDQRFLSEDDLTFMVVPRINAASRMASPVDAFRMLTAEDDTTADETARFLDTLNNERKASAAVLTKEAKRRMEERMAGKGAGGDAPRLIVMGNPNWKPPLLGPVANSLMETYSMPVFLWGRAADSADGTQIIKGSCRSDGSMSVLELMQSAAPGTLLAFGGHRASGGFSVSHEKVHLLEEELARAYEKVRAAHAGEPVEAAALEYDAVLTADEADEKLWRMIERLAPFGEGNPKPLFLFKDAAVAAARQFGKERNHLEVRIARSDGTSLPAIGFFSDPASYGVPLAPGARIDLLATLEKSYFRGAPELRLRIVDIF